MVRVKVTYQNVIGWGGFLTLSVFFAWNMAMAGELSVLFPGLVFLLLCGGPYLLFARLQEDHEVIGGALVMLLFLVIAAMVYGGADAALQILWLPLVAWPLVGFADLNELREPPKPRHRAGSATKHPTDARSRRR